MPPCILSVSCSDNDMLDQYHRSSYPKSRRMTNQNFFGHQTDSQRSLITPCYEHSTHVYVTTKTWQSLIHELDARQRLLKDELVDSFTANENARCEQLAFSCEQ